jgi:hypothetical protein
VQLWRLLLQPAVDKAPPFPRAQGQCCLTDAAKMTATGIAVGMNKGHVVTKRDQAQRPSRRKGVSIDLISSAHQGSRASSRRGSQQ